MRAFRVISSWWTTASIVIAASGSYALLHAGPGLLLYLSLALNLAAASVRVIVSRSGRPKVEPQYIMAMDEHVRLPLGCAPFESAEDLERWFRQNAFYPVSSRVTHTFFIARTGSLSVLPGTAMRLGITVLLVAIAVSANVRQSEERTFHVGEEGTLLGRRVKLAALDAALPQSSLIVGEKGAFELAGLRADLLIGDTELRVTGGYPARADGFYYLRLTDFGYSSVMTVGAHAARVDFDVLPPGKVQRLTLPGGAGEAEVTIEPVKTMTSGLLSGKAYNLDAPRLRMGLRAPAIKGSPTPITPTGEVTSKTRSERGLWPPEGVVLGAAQEAGGIALGELGHYARVRAVRDPALLFVYAGGVLSVLGALSMLSRLFWYQRTMAACISDGEVFIGYTDEYYGRWGVLRFRALIERSGLRPTASKDESDTSG